MARAEHSAKRPSRKTESDDEGKTETRWIVLGADGRHMSLGRTEPSQAEVMAASDALAAQGLPGWLARLQGDYYSRGKVTLEPLRRIAADHEADWQAALAAFQRLRGLALAQAKR